MHSHIRSVQLFSLQKGLFLIKNGSLMLKKMLRMKKRHMFFFMGIYLFFQKLAAVNSRKSQGTVSQHNSNSSQFRIFATERPFLHSGAILSLVQPFKKRCFVKFFRNAATHSFSVANGADFFITK